MKCPGCGDAEVYIGLREVKCIQPVCRYYDKDYSNDFFESCAKIPEIDFEITVQEFRPKSELQTSSAGYRQQLVTPIDREGSQSFLIPTLFTPVDTDRVSLIINGLQYLSPTFVYVAVDPNVSFDAEWLGAFSLTSSDDVVVTWFTDK